MERLYIKDGPKLNKQEIAEIDKAKAREFRVPPMNKEQIRESLFFILKGKTGNLLAVGQVISIEPVYFHHQKFNLLGFGGIIASIKGRGYGKKIMTAIKQYSTVNQKTIIGFCADHNRPFYEKCGFKVDPNSINRFVYYSNGQRITNKTDKCVVHLDSIDRFMEKVLASRNEEVLLPKPPDW